MKNKESIKIILESFDHFVLSKAVNEIIVTVKRTGAGIKGPIPMPTKIQKFCVNRSPHVDKDSREQYEIRTSKRILIISPTAQTVDALMKLNLSAGVEIKIALNGTKN
ncbi:MAG: 30S ribosomal protein S10 [Proteobacteria bacterium]|jgi:small subunit ribosomal protein S10|nr:30S ribosomal protein S10 [Pseudomonadota bacterium]